MNVELSALIDCQKLLSPETPTPNPATCPPFHANLTSHLKLPPTTNPNSSTNPPPIMSEDRTISDHPSTSGLQIALHPLALLTVSDYITRHIVRELQGPIIGALLGAQNGREISIEEAHEVNVHVSDDKEEVTVDKAFFENKLRLCWSSPALFVGGGSLEELIWRFG